MASLKTMEGFGPKAGVFEQGEIECRKSKVKDIRPSLVFWRSCASHCFQFLPLGQRGIWTRVFGFLGTVVETFSSSLDTQGFDALIQSSGKIVAVGQRGTLLDIKLLSLVSIQQAYWIQLLERADGPSLISATQQFTRSPQRSSRTETSLLLANWMTAVKTL